MTDQSDDQETAIALTIARAGLESLDQVIDLDGRITGKPKPEYWQDIFERYTTRHVDERFLLAARPATGDTGRLLGLIAGEVREWEFGSQPCGWIFTVSVDPDFRQLGVGEQLFKAICEEFRKIGIAKVRTMVRRENPLHMSFFRSEGMVAGPYIQFELRLEE